MNDSSIDYADLAEYDRRQRGIERHLLAAFLGGFVVGLAGMFLAGRGPGWVGQVYDPYVYLALSLAVGATASGFGWALLTTFLAAAATLVAAMGASGFGGDPAFDVIGGSAAGLNWTIALLVGLGLLAYATRRGDIWGDLAAGAIGVALMADVVNRATSNFAGGDLPSWPGPAALMGLVSVAAVFALRRRARGHLHALALSAVFAGLSMVCLAALLSGWIPLTV